MKTLLIAFCLSLFTCAASFAQSRSNALSLELGKNGLIFNLTYDHVFANRWGLRAVAGSNLAKYLQAYTAGGGGYYLLGGKGRFLELGADLYYLQVDEVSDDQVGFTILYPDYTIKTLYPSANIGYRSYGPGSLFRIGFSPGVIDGNIIPGGYLSVGFTF